MDWINSIFSQVEQYVSVPYLLTFVLLAYVVKKYNIKLLARLFPRFEWKTVYSVLFLATVTAVPFLLWTETSWTKIVFSYALGTSLHETIFHYVEKFVGKK